MQGVDMSRGYPPPKGTSRWWGGNSPPDMGPDGVGVSTQPPRHRIQRAMVGKRGLRILLECFLV